MQWQQLIDAWQRSSDQNRLNPQASLDELALVEQHLGRALPADLRDFYRISNGASLADGNLQIHELQPRTVKLAKPIVNPFRVDSTPQTEIHKAGLTTQTKFLREHGWLIADEVLVFGGDGSDSLFGIWLPESRGPESPTAVLRHPVVVIGETHETRKNMAVVGTSLLPFLCVCTAFWLLNEPANHAALDALGVPRELRVDAREPLLLARLRKWADPHLPDFDPDPYQRGLDSDALRQLCESH